MGQPTEKKVLCDLYRFIDIRQPEVKWSAITSVLLEILFLFLSLHENFAMYENDICNLTLYIIAGLIGFIGVAIAGIAIIITLFSSEQIELINRLQDGAFSKLLYDFKWFALTAAIETVIFIALIFVIRSPYPVPHKYLFYLTSFILTYAFFYLLFYGSALIGNFMKLSQIKCSLDSALKQSKNIPLSVAELELDFLVSKLLHGDRQSADIFYKELIDFIEKIDRPQIDKDELIRYVKSRHIVP